MEQPLALNNKPDEHVLSMPEIKADLDAFTEAQWIKLGKSANNLCRGLPFEGHDLLHNVLCKALEGKRKCRKGLPIEVFIYGAMESMVDAYIKSRKSDPLENTIQIEDSDSSVAMMDVLQVNLDTPEDEIIANQTLQSINELFEGDERSLKILAYQMDDLSPAEIQHLMQLSKVQYASALKAIRRKCEKLGLQE